MDPVFRSEQQVSTLNHHQTPGTPGPGEILVSWISMVEKCGNGKLVPRKFV